MNKSDLERTFETHWRQLNGPELEPEYRFHPKRLWRFDYAHPQTKIAIELEGGTFSGGRHTRGIGYAQDCIKYNAGVALGWRIFRFTADMLEVDPVSNLEPVIGLIEKETNGDTITNHNRRNKIN